MSLSLDGFPQSSLIPGIALQLYFAQGPAVVPTASRRALYVGPMATGATATPNVSYEIRSTGQANQLFGERSRLARALRKHFRVNPRSGVWAVGYTLVPGTSGTGTITLTGAVTGEGQVDVTVVNELISTSYKVGDTLTTIATAVAANITARTGLPCTASSAVGVVTLAGVHAAASTNGDIRFRASAKSGTGITVATSGSTIGTGSGTPATDGATPELTLFQAALDAVADENFYYLGTLLTSSGSLAATKSHVVLKNTAGVGKYCVSVSAFSGSPGAANTLALALNSELMSLAVQTNSEHDIAEIVADALAARQNREEAAEFNMANLTGYRSSLSKVYLSTDRLDPADIQSMLQNGVTPIQSDETGTYFVKYVTTRSKTPTGTSDDQRAADIHKISAAHNWANRFKALIAVQYPDFFLRPDKRNPDGTIDYAQPIDRKVLQPSILDSKCRSFTQEYRAVLQDVAAAKESIDCDISSQNSSRIELSINLAFLNLAAQFGIEVNEVSS